MPRLRSTTLSSGSVRQEVAISFCFPRKRKYPEIIIIPATNPPRKRYTGISQPQMCNVGSTRILFRVETMSCMNTSL